MVKCLMNEGYIYVTNYSFKFRKKIQEIAANAEKIIPSKILKGIGVFLFGSPSRQEMVDESDADIMIIRKEDGEDYEIFRKEFIRLLEMEDFDKIDVPDWGNYEECEAYLKDSVTEGNQVMESRFIYGDEAVNSYIENLKKRYSDIKRFEKVFCFQKLYFDQYYKQRTRKGVKNVKYGHGGTRDFMFLTWMVNLLDSIERRKINTEDNFPLVYKSLSYLYERNVINFEDYKSYLKSINVVLILRNEILLINKNTIEAGLTYLDEKTISKLFIKNIFKEDSLTDVLALKGYLEFHLKNVELLKGVLWEYYLYYLASSRGREWIVKFKKFLNGDMNSEEVSNISEEDELSQMAVIWNASKEKDKDIFEEIFLKYSRSDKWTILASICCHKDCSDKVLDIVADKGFKKGYEYLLKIISRNKNVSKNTLLKIMNNDSLEDRYRLVAKTAIEGGIEKANELR